MLEVRDLHAFYGRSHVLHGVTLEVQPGEIVALLGRNGSGRSTTARALMGMVAWQGSVAWKGQTLQGKRTFEVARMGLGYVPEARDIFPGLTVHENLLLGLQHSKASRRAARCWSLDDMYRMFGPLKARQHTTAGVLSGGEQQMLTLCRTLMGNPDLVLVDEPTEGLAPAIVEQVVACLRELRSSGVAVLLIEQKLDVAMAISDRALVMGRGTIVFDGPPALLQQDLATRREWLAI